MPITVTPAIPNTITVHLGTPSQNADNVTVPFSDYIKNVASSEIYPTWEPAAIRANVLAQVSFALNRVYTEFYRSRGYDFDITSTTAYDQKYIQGRDIFENVALIVDDVFDSYIRRVGQVEPLAAKFCNGTTTTCDGLSQWGSQDLARQGYDSMQILRYYYDDIELVTHAPFRDQSGSYPGTPMRRGSAGEYVLVTQVMLNRISQNYPAIPKIWPNTAVFDEATENAVRKFQQVFGLTVDGIVGSATWYKMVYLYTGITRLGELVSEGQRFYQVMFQYPGVTSQGDRGEAVSALQYMLAVTSEFYETLPSVQVDGTFGPETTAAVQAFQREAGLTSDGVVGEQTWVALYRVYATLENTQLNREERFPELSQSVNSSVITHYGQTTRMQQFPGQVLTLGQTDD